jgi:hypothetical protein
MALQLSNPKSATNSKDVFIQRFINPDSEMKTEGFIDFGTEKSGKAKYFCVFDFVHTQCTATHAAAKLVYDAAQSCGATIPKRKRQDMDMVIKNELPMRTHTGFSFPTEQQRDAWKEEVIKILGNPAHIESKFRVKEKT